MGHRKIDNRGFTLAEIMMAVAIIIILSAVAFVGVSQYLKSMALLERNGIAKEIFVAAQNHLTMAKGQGYAGITEFGEKTPDGEVTPGGEVASDGEGNSANSNREIYYIIGQNDLMLPFGSIDETVRASGKYLIRYQKDIAQVTDVFYWTANGDRFDIADGVNYSTAMGVKNGGDQTDINGGILGWFGGTDAPTLDGGFSFDSPDIELNNTDILYIKIEDAAKNSKKTHSIRVFVEGLWSGAAAYTDIPYSGNDSDSEVKYIILDDVSNPNRLFKLFSTEDGLTSLGFTPKADTGSFIPGEDIRVYAEIETDEIAEISRSATKATNSLFQAVEAKVDESESGAITITDPIVYISSFRHLENLYKEKSAMVFTETVKAEQTQDLCWNKLDDDESDVEGFIQNVCILHQQLEESDEFEDPVGSDTNTTDTTSSVSEELNIFNESDSSKNCYLPVNPTSTSSDLSYVLNYDGAGKKVLDVQINISTNAGLFGKMLGGGVRNLQLINFKVESNSENAGALAGYMESSSVVNVLAYNDDETEDMKIKAGKDAGGLIGYISGTESAESKVLVSASALIIESGGNAGGLIGSGSGKLTIRGCYSGGHTNNGSYYKDNRVPIYNVITSGNDGKAGGLIGSAEGVTISDSYSTCSVSGATEGGFVGSISEGRITTSYCTGLVDASKTTKGAFAGTYSSDAPSECYYLEIINEITDGDVQMDYLKAVNGVDGEDIPGITAFDSSVTTYNSFVPESDKWVEAVPYDNTLKTYYHDKYNLKAIDHFAPAEMEAGFYPTNIARDAIAREEGEVDTTEYYVLKHYGDWPMPEILVINEATNNAANNND